MTRRRWRQMADGSLVEVDLQSAGTSRNGDSALWGDRHYDGLTTTDGVDISSRTKHRAHLKKHGLATYDDFKGEFERRSKEREAYRAGKHGSVTRADLGRAFYEFKNR